MHLHTFYDLGTALQSVAVIPCLALSSCPQERLFNASWMTFPVNSLEEDAVVMLFDVLYEKLTVFTRQYWLGKGRGRVKWTKLAKPHFIIFAICDHFMCFSQKLSLPHQVSSRCRILLTCIPFRWDRSNFHYCIKFTG